MPTWLAVRVCKFSLLLVGHLEAEAIDWDLRPVSRYVPGGAVSDLVIVGNHAYAVGGDGGPTGLRVFDLNNAAKPVLAGDSYTRERATGLAVAGDYAYVVGYGRLEVLDLRNSAISRWLGICDIPQGDAIRVAVSGHYACVASGNAGLQVVDVSIPANPRPVHGQSIGGFADAVLVSGDHAYLTASRWSLAGTPLGGRLRVFDIRGPANPKPVGDYESRNAVSGLAVSGAYAIPYGSRGSGSRRGATRQCGLSRQRHP